MKVIFDIILEISNFLKKIKRIRLQICFKKKEEDQQKVRSLLATFLVTQIQVLLKKEV